MRDLEAADVAVLKVQPLGGVRACLRIAEDIGLPVVVSSALETSVGIAAGVALAAALPELPSRAASRRSSCCSTTWSSSRCCPWTVHCPSYARRWTGPPSTAPAPRGTASSTGTSGWRR